MEFDPNDNNYFKQRAKSFMEYLTVSKDSVEDNEYKLFCNMYLLANNAITWALNNPEHMELLRAQCRDLEIEE